MVTVGGPHGTGKSTYASALADALNLRYVSAGGIFRELAKKNSMSLEAFGNRAANDPTIDQMIDDGTREEARRGNVVIDAQLAAWIAKELADLKILLTAPDGVRYKRIAEREGITIDQAQRETEARELIQKRRYMQYYGIDVFDLSIYDLKFDTSLHTIEETTALIVEETRSFLSRKEKLGSNV